MRILHLVHQYPPDYRGGTEFYTQTLAAAQAAQGHDVAVCAPVPLPPQTGLNVAVEAGVTIYRVPAGARSRTQVFWHSLRQPGLRRAFHEVLAAFAPELVHIQHMMGWPAGVAADLRATAVPSVVTLHDYWYICANAQLVTNTDGTICAGPDGRAVNCAACALARARRADLLALAPALAPLLRRRNVMAASVLDQAARVIAPTDFVRAIYAEHGLAAGKTVVVPHGIDLPRAPIAAARQARAQRPPRPYLDLGYVGSIGRLKGLHTLIAAVNTLPADAVRLTIYGDTEVFPDYTAELHALATHPGIAFAGPVSRDDLWAALAGFDAVVLPTLWYEVSPLVIDEVFAVGVPILASRIGAMAEKIEEGVNGRLFPPGDAAALAALLRELLADPAQLRRLAGNAPAVYGVAEHMKAVEEVYRTAVDSV